MATTVDAHAIKQVRRELMVMLKAVYPASLSGDVLYRALLGAFPQMAWEYLRKDLAYLVEKGYLTRRSSAGSGQIGVEAWRRDVHRLSATGVELVDRCAVDSALEV